MDKREYENSKAVIEDQRAEAVKLHERAVLAASDGSGAKAQADEAKANITGFDERLETLEIVWKEAQRVASEERLAMTKDKVKAARIAIEKELQAQEAAATRMEKNAAKLGEDGALIDRSCRSVINTIKKHQGLLGGEYQHLLNDFIKGTGKFAQHVAGHLTVSGINLAGANFDNSRFLVKDSKLSGAMRSRNDMARDRLSVLDDIVGGT